MREGPGGGWGVLPYISYIGMCCPKAGKGFLGSPSLNIGYHIWPC